ncbi:glutathione S-transferase family protein [Spiribacter sp. C176]|uniref:Glutathione S-transferase family protein n=1 Tax=Spiribacter salilacus TaxID=2664894 RepID=A0A6N7QLG2_9GAMM|nr:glutathione S-transferase N-terminal domain-containing protein [Spiribacter salilacus]MRH77261.1 glutathione S-transferase family protein [Spiribacter salilacus]
MIDVYSWPTPNGHKVHIALEELGLEYQVHGVNIGNGDQFNELFLEISPNNKIPAITDDQGPDGKPISIFESGAILLYLAEKTGELMPEEPRARYSVLEWLMFQMGGLGPMLGQAHHFRQYAPEHIEYAFNRYTNEASRLYGVLDRRLADREWLAAERYTIADIACFPWIRPYENQGQDLADYPNLARWFNAIAERPAVQRGVAVLADARPPQMDDKAREQLFGAAQYQKR